jgi:hypothetical protein
MFRQIFNELSKSDSILKDSVGLSMNIQTGTIQSATGWASRADRLF